MLIISNCCKTLRCLDVTYRLYGAWLGGAFWGHCPVLAAPLSVGLPPRLDEGSVPGMDFGAMVRRGGDAEGPGCVLVGVGLG
jgi:hypothetical protein